MNWRSNTIIFGRHLNGQWKINLPKRFGVYYTGPDGQDHEAVMLHRALYGSLERFGLDTVDLDRSGPSYTVETLRRLRLRWGDEEPSADPRLPAWAYGPPLPQSSDRLTALATRP